MPHGKVGSTEWIAWFQSLSQNEQIAYLRDVEKSLFPSAPTGDNWKAATVKAGPGGTNECFPCKVLTQYKPLLQVRQGIGVVGLAFSLNRKGDSIVTSIWAPNAKNAITIDWRNNRILPADIKNTTPGTGLAPQSLPDGMLIMGDSGKLCLSIDLNGPVLPWRDGVRAQSLAMDRNEGVAFGTVYTEQEKSLNSIICINVSPPKILGEIQMPESKTAVWCLYEPAEKVLLVVEHDWNWIAMIDFAKNSNASAKSNDAK